MTLREKILQTFIVSIREINKHGGPQKFFDKYPVGGMYYWETKELEGKVEEGTSTTYSRLLECKKASKKPLFICADFTQIPGQEIVLNTRPLGASKNMNDAYEFGKMLGMQMNSHGVDWILGPCIDILYDRSMPLHAISDDPILSAEIFRNVIRGIHSQGVCATAKHFPGLGTNSINMHFGHGRNVLPFDEWMSCYGYMYKEMFKENVDSVMTSHVSLKSFADEYENGFYPIATFSKKLTVELLKEKLGFKGAVVTDALIMGGMATGNLIEETVQAFRSGADLLLWPPVEAAERIEELIVSGDIPMSRLDDALSRIQKMKDFRNDALQNHKYDEPDALYADNLSRKVIEHGICNYKNELGLLPINNKNKKILIIDAIDDVKDASSYLKRELEEEGFIVDVKRDIYDVPSRVCWQSDLDDLQKDYDLCIFNLFTTYATSWSVPFMLIWASQLFDKKKKIIINYGSPFFAEDYFESDHTIVEVNASPSEATAKIVAKALVGKIEMTGGKVLSDRTKKI